ncbi:MAG: NAD(P)/FAD-dependent oxidoreductase [Candidatus Izemoplasmataceae bacterium]
MYDFIIIGAGVTGANIARELSKYEVEVLLLEKENDVANHATIANSAIVHSGHDPKENTLKARLCVRGNELYDQLEKDLNIPLLRNGAMVVAYSAEELEILYTLYERAQKNGVDVKFLTAEEAYALEPNLNDDLMKALSLPTTKVTYPWEVAIACVENAVENGVILKKNQAVKTIKKEDDIFIVKTETDTFKARYVINAAGVFAENIAHMVENNVAYKMTPRRGEYFVLDRRVKGFVNHTIYPIPSSKGKGVY